ncbi:MAG: Uma2 family endonuclease [Chitinophagales bacterium]
MKDLVTQKISFLEYLELEEQSEGKHEYHDGFVWAMVGGTLNHGIISGNAFAALSSVLRKKDGNNCKPINSDVKIFIESANRGVYPDAMVICGKFDYYLNRKDTVINPKLIIEVLSPSTAAFDRGDKFRFYKSLPSFREYILIHQDQPFVEGYYWEDKELWRISHAIGLEENIQIHSIEAEIYLKDIYAFIELSGSTQTKLDL